MWSVSIMTWFNALIMQGSNLILYNWLFWFCTDHCNVCRLCSRNSWRIRMANYARFVETLLELLPLVMSLLLAMSVPSLFVVLAMNTRGEMGIRRALSVKLGTRDTKVSLASHNLHEDYLVLCFSSINGGIWIFCSVIGSPRVDGDDDEDDIDDLENEFSYSQGKMKARSQWHGDDVELSGSSRHESQQPIPLLTNGQPVSQSDSLFINIYMQNFFVNLIISWLPRIGCASKNQIQITCQSRISNFVTLHYCCLYRKSE